MPGEVLIVVAIGLLYAWGHKQVEDWKYRRAEKKKQRETPGNTGSL